MDVKGFQAWLSAASGLTRAQRREALGVLSGRSVNRLSILTPDWSAPLRVDRLHVWN